MGSMCYLAIAIPDRRCFTFIILKQFILYVFVNFIHQLLGYTVSLRGGLGFNRGTVSQSSKLYCSVLLGSNNKLEFCQCISITWQFLAITGIILGFTNRIANKCCRLHVMLYFHSKDIISTERTILFLQKQFQHKIE